jgi:hypothetical protein
VKVLTTTPQPPTTSGSCSCTYASMALSACKCSPQREHGALSMQVLTATRAWRSQQSSYISIASIVASSSRRRQFISGVRRCVSS